MKNIEKPMKNIAKTYEKPMTNIEQPVNSPQKTWQEPKSLSRNHAYRTSSEEQASKSRPKKQENQLNIVFLLGF